MTEPVIPKGHDPKEIFQKIKSDDLWETDLVLEPEHIPWIYIGNIIQRTLSRMIGQGPYGPVTVKCTKEGNLAVVARGGAFDDYERLEWAFTSAGDSHTFEFTQQVERIDIFTYSDRMEYQLSRDLTKSLGDKLELFEDSFYSLDFYTRRVKATCVSYTPKVDGTTNAAVSANHLLDDDKDFSTDSLCAVGDVVANVTTRAFATVTAVADHDLTLSADIFLVNSEDYTIDGPRVRLMGWFQA